MPPRPHQYCPLSMPQSVAQLGHALHKEKLDESAVVYVHWPKQRCHLLRDDVVFVDSPGIDVTQVGLTSHRAGLASHRWV